MLSKIYSSTYKRVPAVRVSTRETVPLCESNCSANSLRNAILTVNSLSLDAPFVAVTWLWCFSSIYKCPVPYHNYTVLFCITWLAYSGDRLLDSLRLTGNAQQTPRHQFTSRHFKPLLALWCLTALSALFFLPATLDIIEIRWGFGLLGILSLYFGGCYYLPHLTRKFLTRELLVGIFFSVATHFFIVTQLKTVNISLVWTSLCFSMLCSLNCLLISYWELTSDDQAGEVTFFTSNPARVHQLPKVIAMFLLLQFAISMFLILHQTIPVFELSILSSTFLFWILDRSHIHTQLKPVLADAALLTPWLILSIFS